MKRWVPYIFLALLAAVFWTLNAAVPFFSDDLLMQGAFDGRTFWQCMEVVVRRVSTAWINENGRAMNHAVWQLTIGCGEPVYDGFVTICLVLTFILLNRVALRRGLRLWSLALMAVVVFYLAPDADSFFYWAGGGCHYLFPTLLAALFLLSLRHVERRVVSGWQLWLAVVLSFASGWTHEIFALPISFALFVYLIVHKKDAPGRVWLLALAYWLGALLIVVAPGTLSRIVATQGGEVSFLSKLLTSFKVFRYGRLFYVVLLLVMWQAMTRRHSLRAFMRREAFFFCCLAAALGIVVVLGVGGRAVWSVEVFSLFLLLRWIDGNCWMETRAADMASAIVLALLVIHQTCLVEPFREAWGTYKDMEQQARNVRGENCCFPMDDWHADSPLVDPFVAHPYRMMRQDYWMRYPLHCDVCRSDEYAILSHMSADDFTDGAARRVGGDFFCVSSDSLMSDIAAGRWQYTLHPIGRGQGGWLYVAWHSMLQRFVPSRYPAVVSVNGANTSRIRIGDVTYIRFDRPVAPVRREIISCEYAR